MRARAARAIVMISLAVGGAGCSGSTPYSAFVAPTTSPPQPAAVAPVPPGASISGRTPCPRTDGSSPRVSHFSQPPPACINPALSFTATFSTTQGPIVVDLDAVHASGTVNNFVVLARYHYYDGSALFRIDRRVDIIQGGSPSTQSADDPGPGYTINDQGPLTTDANGALHGPWTYQPGDLAMARTQAPKSAAAQFFFTVGPNSSKLDAQGTYVVFGHVRQGLDVLQYIEANLYAPCVAPAACSAGGGAPRVPVTIQKILISIGS